MNVREFLDNVRQYRKTFLAAFLTVLALGLAWLLLTPLQYVSRAQLLVSLNGTSTANAYQNDNVVAGRVNSYVALLTSETVSQRVVDKLGLKMSPAQLAAKVSAVQVPPNTAVIDIAVSDPSAEQAKTIAGTVADEFVAYTTALESPTGVDEQKVQTTVVSQASQPTSRLPERITIGGLVGLLALLAGAFAVWIRAGTDRVVRTPSQACSASGLPLLAVADRARDADSVDIPEPYRRVRAALKRADGTVIHVTPADRPTDASPVALDLGRAMVRGGERCVVVDATGGETTSEEALQTGRGGQPDTLVSAAVLPSLGTITSGYQKVVIATAPAGSHRSPAPLSEYADSVVLVVTLGQSRRSEVRRATESLTGVGAHVAGILAVR